ncbi:MAG TPA: putative zinc-binding metallopeptidase [Terriglobales bacterium]|nr:putative zinc-binding metallopeptidase [Terriglobales bacterium]
MIESGEQTGAEQPGSLLDTRICDLGLTIEGSAVEKFVQQLYRDLEQKKILKFRPACYLTDEWGCPSGEPIIGIPFYLARPDLAQVEKENNDLESDREIMMYLRHEAGHAFNYAYRLHRTPEWKQLFGPYRRPYRENYRPVLFSKDYVRYLPGWYAQKHPDEDFAETFAVWLTPRSNWRKKYRDWGAIAKLRYMDRIARELGNVDPQRKRGTADFTTSEMELTVGEFYRNSTTSVPFVEITQDADLTALLDAPTKNKHSFPADVFLKAHRKTIVDHIARWTAMQRPMVRKFMESLEKRSAEMGLMIDRRREAEHLSEIAVFATTLVMNHLARSKAFQA